MEALNLRLSMRAQVKAEGEAEGEATTLSEALAKLPHLRPLQQWQEPDETPRNLSCPDIQPATTMQPAEEQQAAMQRDSLQQWAALKLEHLGTA